MAAVGTVVRSRGVGLAVEVVGDGEPVTLLAHGLTACRADVALFAPFLPGTKVLFDFRGHGESDRPGPGSYSMEHFAADLESVSRAFKATAFAGISLGSAAALRLLTKDPNHFEKLVFVLPARLDPTMDAHSRLLRIADLLDSYPLEEVADRVVAEEAAAGLFEKFPAGRELRRASVLRMHRDGMPHAIREVLGDPPVAADADNLASVTTPALVIAQRGDPIHRAEVAQELAARLPRSELVLFEDPNALISRIPEVVQRISAFLDA